MKATIYADVSIRQYAGVAFYTYAPVYNKDMKTIADRLRDLLTEKGWKPYRLFKESGVSQPTIARILSGESKVPEKETVEKLAKALGTSYSWLYDGIEEQIYSSALPPVSLAKPAQKGQITEEKSQEDWRRFMHGIYPEGNPEVSSQPKAKGELIVEGARSIPVGGRPIPIISFVQAGAWTATSDPYEPGDGEGVAYTRNNLSENAFALRVSGNSMSPEFNEGDIIIVDPLVQPRPGCYVIAKNGETEATFKKYRPRGNGSDGKPIIELVPLNDDHPSLRSDITPFEIIGTVVEHHRFFGRK